MAIGEQNTYQPQRIKKPKRLVVEVFYKRVSNFVGFGMKSKKLDLSRPSHKFAYNLHIASTIFFMMYGLIYMADYYLFKSKDVLFLTDSVSFLSFCRKYLEQRDVTLALEIYYITGAFLGACISVPAAFYYYFSGGRKYDRREVVRFYWHGWLAASVLKIVLAPVFLVAVYLGGRLIGIGVPAIFYLVHIPGFFIIQLMILSKILGLLTAGLTDSLFPLFPYPTKKDI